MTERAEAGTEGLRERKRAHSRATTVDVAMQLFAERGYDTVTVADICAAAEIAPRTFFRYFPTKEDVLAEPARQMAARLTAALAAAPDAIDDAGALRGALRELGEYVVADRTRMAVFFRVAAAASAVRANPFLHLSGRERQLTEELLRRRPGSGAADWRTRLMVARALAAFRVWLDDLVAGGEPDPLGHLDEVLAAP
ncbi:TetR/AcrR family transcriptional regulator [Modestobacter excelsi]|uniref:TetR/AcrR family transcriptional regulator n=1 Tax=Modestobacter excelsi TaxID=2213161 RepID=UPI001C20EC21|nr:TetR/AcrR family transcriptional regulator [Modestobacter excelsi]